LPRNYAASIRRHPIDIERIDLENGKVVLVLKCGVGSLVPYAYNGRPFRRITSTTSPMPQEEYQRQLLERDHARQRWENLPAAGYPVEDLDAAEIQQTVTESIAAGRLLGPWSGPVDTLQKFHLLVDGVPTQAAVVAFAKEPLPDYPQCALRLARFRGVTKNEFFRPATTHRSCLFAAAGIAIVSAAAPARRGSI
jgi:ATP-dependent DNA helicase RecG